MDAVLAYAKSVAAAVGTFATLVSAVLADNAVSLDELDGLRTAGLAVLTVAGVYAVKNKPAVS